jgi:hypothetical protein
LLFLTWQELFAARSDRLLYRPVLRVFYAALFDANVGRQILEPARLAETDSEIIIIKGFVDHSFPSGCSSA